MIMMEKIKIIKTMKKTEIIIELIEKKIKERLVFIKKYDKSLVDKSSKFKTLSEIPEPKEIDSIGKEILKHLKKDFDILPVDFIVESLTHLGHAPNIIYDDNGLFAVTAEGFQSVVTGNQKIEGTFLLLVEKKQWKKSIREALKQYMK
jgi:hypothetical protein